MYVSNRSVHVRLWFSKSSENHRAACRQIRTEATCDDVVTATKTPRTPMAH